MAQKEMPTTDEKPKTKSLTELLEEEQLYERLFKMAVLKLGPEQSAEAPEIVQSAFQDLLAQEQATGQKIEQPKAWLYRVVKNKVARFIRQKRSLESNEFEHVPEKPGKPGPKLKAPPTFVSAEDPDIALADDLRYSCTDDYFPEEYVTDEIIEQCLQRILEQLSDVDKKLTMWYYLEKRPVGEIAEAFQTSKNSIHNRVKRLESRLKQMAREEIKKKTGNS